MKRTSRKILQKPKLPKRLTAGAAPVLADDGDYSGIELTGCRLTEPAAKRLLFETVSFRRAVFGPSRHAKPRFTDCRLEGCDLSGVDWEKARFRRVEFLDCRAIGAQLPGAVCDDVLFRGCNLERSLFLSAAFRTARFEDCILREASFEGADLAFAVFANCDLTRADLRGAKLAGADLRGSKLDGAQAGAQELCGAVVDSGQAVRIAGLLGVIVKEPGEDLEDDAEPEAAAHIGKE